VRRGLAWKNADYLGVIVLGDEPSNMAVPDDEVAALPDKFEITNNYPNPFNNSTCIRVALPTRSRLKAEVYDIQGRLIRKVMNMDCGAGYHTIEWNGTDSYGIEVPSGVYLFKVVSGRDVKTMKIVLQK